MPPRKSSSPAPSARGSAASPAAKTPASEKKAPASSRPSKSPARGSKKAAAASPAASSSEDAVESKAASPAAATTKSALKAPPAVTTKAKPSSPAPSDNTCVYVALAFAVVAALVGVAAMWPLEGAPLQKVPALSAKAFKGNELYTGTYTGSALVAFTNNVTMDSSCWECVELDTLMKLTAFRTMMASWKDANVVRIGKVNCNQNADVCSRFGVVGVEGEEPSLPHILWFKGGKEVGQFDGERTLDGFQKWVEAKQSAGEL